jgi:hypothetical protein
LEKKSAVASSDEADPGSRIGVSLCLLLCIHLCSSKSTRLLQIVGIGAVSSDNGTSLSRRRKPSRRCVFPQLWNSIRRTIGSKGYTHTFSPKPAASSSFRQTRLISEADRSVATAPRGKGSDLTRPLAPLIAGDDSLPSSSSSFSSSSASRLVKRATLKVLEWLVRGVGVFAGIVGLIVSGFSYPENPETALLSLLSQVFIYTAITSRLRVILPCYFIFITGVALWIQTDRVFPGERKRTRLTVVTLFPVLTGIVVSLFLISYKVYDSFLERRRDPSLQR